MEKIYIEDLYRFFKRALIKKLGYNIDFDSNDVRIEIVIDPKTIDVNNIKEYIRQAFQFNEEDDN